MELVWHHRIISQHELFRSFRGAAAAKGGLRFNNQLSEGAGRPRLAPLFRERRKMHRALTSSGTISKGCGVRVSQRAIRDTRAHKNRATAAPSARYAAG